MRRWSKEHKALLIHVSVALLWVTLVWLSYGLFPNQLGARKVLSRIVFIGIATQLLVLAIYQRRKTLRMINQFFTATAPPINLAVFRIVFFWILFNFVDTSLIVRFSQFPTELQFAPKGLEWLLPYLPINQTSAKIACIVLLICCFTAMIGLFTRTSAALATILGFYALGIPQFFGKVGHYHHLIWFAAILAASRCGDVFSCDAVRAAWKRADRGMTEPPASSQAYALPLRFVWLLIGMIYFFPGLWKVGRSGFDWALSENFKYQLYGKWLELGGWTPFLRLDQYPLLYKLAALGAMVFELSFIFLIFFPRLRLLAVLGGIIFHSMIALFMRISFWTLQACYVAFFDWNAIFHRLGRWLYREEMYIVYDGNCKLCRRTIASLRVFDILGRVTYVNALDQQVLNNHRLLWLDSTALLSDMHAVVDRKTWTGFSSYRALAPRIPILWPVLPLLYLWPVPIIGNRIYRAVADLRTCSIADVPLAQTAGYKYKPQPRLPAVVMTGIFLLSVNIPLGFRELGDSWPFACYPTFARIADAQQQSLEILPLNSAGRVITWDELALSQRLTETRYKTLILRILKREDPTRRNIQLESLWQMMVQNEPSLRPAASVQFYKVTVWNIPEKQPENPVAQELLYELKL